MESVKAIHKRLYEETINQKKLGKATSAQMLNVAFSSTKTLKNQLNATGGADVIGVALASMVFDLLKKRKTERKLSSMITKEADKQEGDSKRKVIDSITGENIRKSRAETLKTGEEQDIDTDKIMIFYLASAHKDSASDHKDYQGKVYVDENWETIPMPFGLHNAIKYYIKTHNVKTIQWVTGKPVWFITRPNCRHYFKEMSVKEVLANSKTSLIKQYDMKTAIGDRQYLQTMKHATSKEWYDDVRNAQLLLESYKERLSLHEQMYQEKPCPELKNAIAKDKFLIQKWEKYIASKN